MAGIQKKKSLSYASKFFGCWENCITCPLVSVNRVYLQMNSGSCYASLALPTLPPCPLRGSYCASLNLLPPFHVSHCVYAHVCVYVCETVCVSVCGSNPVWVDTEVLPFRKWAAENQQVGPSVSCMCLVTVVFFFSEWNAIVYSKFATWPKAVYLITHSDLSCGWLDRLGIRKLEGRWGERQWGL